MEQETWLISHWEVTVIRPKVHFGHFQVPVAPEPLTLQSST